MPAAPPTPSWRASTLSALDGAAWIIPFSLGSVTLVFARVGPELLASGVFATMLALACVHAMTLRNRRPVLFAGRFFEATMMAAMMDQVIVRLPVWGLTDTTGVRLALLCMIGAGAGLFVGVLYLIKAGRFTRYIPAPVFAGFYNSIALALLVSQLRSLSSMASGTTPMPVVASLATVAMVSAFAARRWRPDWPAAAVALGSGIVLGTALLIYGGHSTPVVIPGGWALTLPIFMADFRALAEPGVDIWALTQALVSNSAALGVMMFINTTMTAQALTQADGRRADGPRGAVAIVAGMALAGLVGSTPMSASTQASAAATRISPLTPAVIGLCCVITASVYLSGVLGLLPLAAVAGALMREAWFQFDRGSVRLLLQWLGRRRMPSNAREDLALVAAVTATAVLANMVAAVFAGLLLGLALFAVRNARRPVRHIWTGAQLSSNCARSRSDLNVLFDHGATIKIFELEGDLFFGAAESLERSVLDGSKGAVSLILDWSRVRHIDSSLALSVANIERVARADGLVPIHAGAHMQGDGVGTELRRFLSEAHFERDLDYALEHAENEVIERYRQHSPTDTTSMLDVLALFEGLPPHERAILEQAMPERFFPRGSVIIAAGDPPDELMLLLHGSASILVHGSNGLDIRLAGVRRGATIGEIGFLDHSPRSATVVAQEDVVVAVLDRKVYDALCESQPHLVQQLLANIALNVVARLRRTNQLALARFGGH